MNDGAVDAAIATLSPVRGFRPVRAGRLFVENLPNPVTDTVSPFARPKFLEKQPSETS